jgi:hypothetical protein
LEEYFMEKDEKTLNMNGRKPYNEPELTLYGEVTELTDSGSMNEDEAFVAEQVENPETIGPGYKA